MIELIQGYTYGIETWIRVGCRWLKVGGLKLLWIKFLDELFFGKDRSVMRVGLAGIDT